MAVTPFKSSDNFNMAGFNEKITEADNTYVAKTGDSMTGTLSMGNNKITDVMSPVNDGDAVNKGYVDGIGSDVFEKFSIEKEIDCEVYSGSTKTGTAKIYNSNGGAIIDVSITVSNSTVGRLYRKTSSGERGKSIHTIIYGYNTTIYATTDTVTDYVPQIESNGIISFSTHQIRNFSLYIPFYCK